MRDRTVDIVLIEPAIELHRRGETLDKRIGRFAEAASPEFAGVFCFGIVGLVAHGRFPLLSVFGGCLILP